MKNFEKKFEKSMRPFFSDDCEKIPKADEDFYDCNFDGILIFTNT